METYHPRTTLRDPRTTRCDPQTSRCDPRTSSCDPRTSHSSPMYRGGYTMVHLIYLILITLYLTTNINGVAGAVTTVCQQFNVDAASGNVSTTTDTCPQPDGSDKRAHCYALWFNESNVITMKMKGCWLDERRCYDQERCVEARPHPLDPDKPLDHYFCCCDGDMCNQEVLYRPVGASSANVGGEGLSTPSIHSSLQQGGAGMHVM